MPIELFVRHFLGIFFLMIGVLFASRILGLHRRLPYPVVHYGRRGSTTWWHRQSFNAFRALILGVCLARIVLPVDPWLGLFPVLYQPPVLLLGVLLLLTGFARVCYVQGYLNTDWRSGIDEQNPPDLITGGPYGRSRNPAFAAVVVGQLGFFFALPSLFALVCLIVGILVMHRQALAEEQALARLYGDAYAEYRHRVPRWR